MILNRDIDENENSNEDKEKYNAIEQRDEEKEYIYKKDKKTKKTSSKKSKGGFYNILKLNVYIVFIIIICVLLFLIKIFFIKSNIPKKSDNLNETKNSDNLNETKNSDNLNNTKNNEANNLNINNTTNSNIIQTEIIKINETELRIKKEKERIAKINNELIKKYDRDGKINIIQFYEEIIFNKSYSLPETFNYSNIHINIGFTDEKINLIIKHISSILYTASPKTFIHIHMMDAGIFNYETLLKLGNMIYKLNNLTEIIVYNATQVLKDFVIRSNSISKFSQEYAKLYAFKILKNIKKIIFMDGDDCMVQKDLNELYKMNMDNIYARGITEEPTIRYSMDWMDNYLYDRTHYINGGVILINLELCQKEDFYEKAKKLNNDDIFYKQTKEPAQDIINVLLRRKIEFFDPRFNKINYYEKEEDKNNESKWYYWMKKVLKMGNRNNHFYTKEELIEADKDPVIIHYAWDRYLQKNVDKYEKEKQFYGNLTGIN